MSQGSGRFGGCLKDMYVFSRSSELAEGVAIVNSSKQTRYRLRTPGSMPRGSISVSVVIIQVGSQSDPSEDGTGFNRAFDQIQKCEFEELRKLGACERSSAMPVSNFSYGRPASH